MLVELGLVEQRHQAVLEVLNDGATVLDVVRRYRVARQTVHDWLCRYAHGGLAGLADKTSRPLSWPHQRTPMDLGSFLKDRRERNRPVQGCSCSLASATHGIEDSGRSGGTYLEGAPEVGPPTRVVARSQWRPCRRPSR